jgi:hypothetical protein
MKRTLSVLTIAAMTLAAAGARAYAQQPDRAPQNSEMWRAYVEHFPIGSTVNIRTTAGERLTAVLLIVDDTGMTVKPKTRFPEPARRVAFDRIEDLSVRQGRVSIAKYAGVGAAVGAGVFMWLLTIATR